MSVSASPVVPVSGFVDVSSNPRAGKTVVLEISFFPIVHVIARDGWIRRWSFDGRKDRRSLIFDGS